MNRCALVLLWMTTMSAAWAQTTLPDLLAQGQWSTELGLDVRVQGPCNASSMGLVCVGPFGNASVGESLLGIYDGLGWNILTAAGNQIDGGVDAVLITGDGILIGGSFSQVGGVSASNLALWDGSNWQSYGDPDGSVHALALDGAGDLFAGGSFGNIGGVSATRVARRNAGAWQAMGTGADNSVQSLAAFGSGMQVAGTFSVAGGMSANGIALWSGASWSTFNGGTGGGTPNDVYSVVADGSTFYIAGNFTQAGGVPSNDAAYWNGASWQAMPGYSGAVPLNHNIALVGGDAFFQGDFSGALGYPAGVARWDGANWQAIAASGSFTQQFELDGLDPIDDELFIADVSLDNIAYYANGSVLYDPSTGSFRTSGDGLGYDDGNGFIESVVQVGNTIYAGGRLNVAGGRKHCCGLFGRDLSDADARWEPVGSQFDGQIETLFAFEGALWISGNLNSAGGSPSARVARFDPGSDSWSDHSAGLPSAPLALQSLQGTLYAGVDPPFNDAAPDPSRPCLFAFDPNGNQWTELLDCGGAIVDPTFGTFVHRGFVADLSVGPGDNALTVAGDYVVDQGTIGDTQQVWSFDPDSLQLMPIRSELFSLFSDVRVVARGIDLTCAGGNFNTLHPVSGDTIRNLVCWTDAEVFNTVGGVDGGCSDPFAPRQCVRDLVIFEGLPDNASSPAEHAAIARPKGAVQIYILAALGLLEEAFPDGPAAPLEISGAAVIDVAADQVIQTSLGVSHDDGNAGLDSMAVVDPFSSPLDNLGCNLMLALFGADDDECQDWRNFVALPRGQPGVSQSVPSTIVTGGRHDYVGPGSDGAGSPAAGAPGGNVGAFRFGFDWGDAPQAYGTRQADNGPFHSVIAGLNLGPAIDAELDGVPSGLALADDLGGDDEDGVFIPLILPGEALGFDIRAAAAGFVNVWIDFDSDLSFDVGDRVLTNVPVVAGLNSFTVATPATADFASSFARVRYTPALGSASPLGFDGPGEVEDHEVFIVGGQADFGDAPAPYPTLDADNGARHAVLGTFKLGLLIDAEVDGLPHPTAEGDDNDMQSDDEDGVTIDEVMAGQANTIQVSASRRGALYGWIDFNADGDWDDAGEQILDARIIEAGTGAIDFDAPAVVVLGESFARFRFTTPPADGDPPLLPFDPPAADLMVGEVEDYRVQIVPMGADIFSDGFE